jgi:hypothetical protein
MLISEIQFMTKGAAQQHARSIRRKYLQHPGVPFSPADHAFIIDYTMQTHDEAEEKIGIGVREIVMLDVQDNFKHGVNGADGRVLHFVRHDGSKVRVNLRGCKRSHRGDVMQAFRHAAGMPPRGDACDWCDSLEGPFHAHHVDYEFAELVKFFLESHELAFDSIGVDRSGVLPRFADPKLANDWLWFHAQYAEFETLCVKCLYQEGHGWDYETC